jgi:OPT family oligopeptide transporter
LDDQPLPIIRLRPHSNVPLDLYPKVHSFLVPNGRPLHYMAQKQDCEHSLWLQLGIGTPSDFFELPNGHLLPRYAFVICTDRLCRRPSDCSSHCARQHICWNGLLVLVGRRVNVVAKSLVQPILSCWIVSSLFSTSNGWPLVYDNKGEDYNVTKILGEDSTLNLEGYKNYSPLLQGPRLALAYSLSFASIASVLVHTALYEGKAMMLRWKSKTTEKDPHMMAMQKYPEVPEWWYQVLFVALCGASLGVVIGYPTFLPWWGFFITLLMPIVFILPVGIILARTNQEIGLNVITEFVAGYIWPGKPIANVLVKVFGYMTMYRGLLFVGDLKLGVYMKIPPRAMFRFQIIGSFAATFTALCNSLGF